MRQVPVGTRFGVVLAAAVWMALQGTAVQAGVYKWVDENGKVHFSDKPPAKAKAEEIETESLTRRAGGGAGAHGTPVAVALQPIAAPGSTRVVKLENIVLDPGKEAGQFAGTVYGGRGCTRRQTRVSQATKRTRIRAPEFERAFAEALEAQGYSVAKSDEVLFAGQEKTSAELQLAAVISDVSMNGCQPDPRKPNARLAAFMRIDWKLFDVLEREIVFETTSEGSSSGQYDSSSSQAMSQARSKAFRMAVDNLLADEKFVARLSGRPAPAAVAGTALDAPLNLELRYGAANGSFIDRVETLKRSTVTVRAGGGHGTGFLIDADGHVLTNAHVVGGADTVLVQAGDREMRASVLRVRKKRDVALLKLEAPIGEPGLRLSLEPARTGGAVYVIGTPLSESLNHTVTSGIISAVRTMEDQQPYYQTDAAVNPGNSGGPAFNELGEVVGMAVAGLFTRQGGSLNINFLIPIDEALAALTVF